MRIIGSVMGILLVLTSIGASAETVATVGDTAITREQLEIYVKPQLIEIDGQRYEALRSGLDEMIAEQLVAKEAKARGVTEEELLEQEVGAKVSEPSDEMVQAVYEANKQQLGGQTLEQVKPRILDYLMAQQEQQLQASFLGSLRSKYPTKVTLKAPTVEVSTGGRPAKGPKNAPITIIEFSDYECPFCKRAEPTVAQVIDTYGDKVRFVYRHFPLEFHANARPAAEAAECAGAQGKFWEYHEKIFAASALNEETYRGLAGEIGLDQGKFDECLASGEMSVRVDEDVEAGSGVGVRGTPAFFINGRMLSGAQPFAKFKEVIDEELASQGAS